jgi:hypothetical protein
MTAMDKSAARAYPVQEYKVMVDGFVIERVDLPANLTQGMRDDVRKALSKEYSVPQHYIRLQPTRR